LAKIKEAMDALEEEARQEAAEKQKATETAYSDDSDHPIRVKAATDFG
jgi:hypothetical protein